MMEVVNFVAGVGCGVLGGTVVSLLLLIWQSALEEKQARRREKPQIDVQRNFQLWQVAREAQEASMRQIVQQNYQSWLIAREAREVNEYTPLPKREHPALRDGKRR